MPDAIADLASLRSSTAPLVPGRGAVQGIFLANRADVMLGYCSSFGTSYARDPGPREPSPAAVTDGWSRLG